MKIPTLLLATALLAFALPALAPAASATTCAADDPLVERYGCGVILAAFCLGEYADEPVYLVKKGRECANVSVLP